MCHNSTYRRLFEENRPTVRAFVHPVSGDKTQNKFMYSVRLHQYYGDYGPTVYVLELRAYYGSGFDETVVVNEYRLLAEHWTRERALRHAIAAFDEMVTYIEHTPAGEENFEYNPNWS